MENYPFIDPSAPKEFYVVRIGDSFWHGMKGFPFVFAADSLPFISQKDAEEMKECDELGRPIIAVKINIPPYVKSVEDVVTHDSFNCRDPLTSLRDFQDKFLYEYFFGGK